MFENVPGLHSLQVPPCGPRTTGPLGFASRGSALAPHLLAADSLRLLYISQNASSLPSWQSRTPLHACESGMQAGDEARHENDAASASSLPHLPHCGATWPCGIAVEVVVGAVVRVGTSAWCPIAQAPTHTPESSWRNSSAQHVWQNVELPLLHVRQDLSHRSHENPVASVPAV